jgi:hypothetical protein
MAIVIGYACATELTKQIYGRFDGIMQMKRRKRL